MRLEERLVRRDEVIADVQPNGVQDGQDRFALDW
jgi:hypothetical protein